jgi:O-antigen ligase
MAHFFSPAAFLILLIPFGVAVQNIGLALTAFFFVFLWLSQSEFRQRFKLILNNPWVLFFLASWVMSAFFVCVSSIAHGNFGRGIQYLVGYSFIGMLPFLIAAVQRHKGLVTKQILFVSCLTAIVAISQLMFAWKIEENKIVSTIHRAQGFFSHPLTLAYAASCFSVFSVSRVIPALANARIGFYSVLVFICHLLILLSSYSLTVMAVYALILVGLFMYWMPRRVNVLGILASIVVGLVVMLTTNPISHKLWSILSGRRSDRESPFFDDRIAFWWTHVHMISKNFFIGLGAGITSADRRPYYEELGLGYLKRMYEAHNMFLQMASEGGIFALVFFLLAIFGVWKLMGSLEGRYSLLGRISLIAFLLTGLTQNALQDSEVRFAALVGLGLVFLYGNLWLSNDSQKKIRFD